jgi:hypothetical protein
MSDPRIKGLTLMAISIAAFVGTTSDRLPPITFFPALVLFAAGAMSFLRRNHEALEKAEERTQRALNPVIRERTTNGRYEPRPSDKPLDGGPPSIIPALAIQGRARTGRRTRVRLPRGE